MEIILGKTAGFCYGVKRAIDGATLDVKEKGKVNCLGEIVHNRQVIEQLENKGIKFIDDISQAEDEVIIRAHGVPKEVYDYAKMNNIKIKDYTCPNVLKIHEIVEQYSKNGYYIFLCGSKEHPENIGTMSYCGNNYFWINKENDTFKALEDFKKTKLNKVLLISQTTYSLESFYIVEEIIRNELNKNVEFIVKNTICKATELRQKETEGISKRVDYMIIIGGKNSSNTKKLYELAKNNCNNTICIETKEEIDVNLIKKCDKIGIMAGASTPQKSIREVMDLLNQKDLINM